VTKLVLVELGSLDDVRRVTSPLGREVDFNLSTASSAVVIHHHILIQLLNGKVISSSSNIKHETMIWLQVLADSLEEPFMTVDFSIISLFNGKHKVDPSTLQAIRF
jgi:hypothetical protein